MYHIMYTDVNGMKLSICVFIGLCNFIKYSSFYAAKNYTQERKIILDSAAGYHV
jgi:hypothetical protein